MTGQPEAEWTLLLSRAAPPRGGAPGRWLRWPDFWLPADADARSAFEEAHRLAAGGLRVEVACGGGTGRTGTALACIAQLGGVPPDDATAWVRRRYRARAVETPWQRRYVRGYLRLPVANGHNSHPGPTVGTPRVNSRA